MPQTPEKNNETLAWEESLLRTPENFKKPQKLSRSFDETAFLEDTVFPSENENDITIVHEDDEISMQDFG